MGGRADILLGNSRTGLTKNKYFCSGQDALCSEQRSWFWGSMSSEASGATMTRTKRRSFS